MELFSFLVVVVPTSFALAAMLDAQVFQKETLLSNLALFLACQILKRVKAKQDLMTVRSWKFHESCRAR